MQSDNETRRAQLWALYFGMQGLSNPPAFLRRAQEELGEHLDVYRDDASTGGQVAGLLQLVGDGEGKSKQLEDVKRWKFEHETLMARVISSVRSQDAIENFIGDPSTEIITLEDLGRFERSTIAAIPGVGPKTMAQIDEAFVERRLVWADRANIGLAAVAGGGA